jgi:hypothetical protein
MRGVRALSVVLALTVLVLPACGDDDDDDGDASSASTSVTTDDDDDADDGECPFDGSTDDQTGNGSAGDTALIRVDPGVSGCIDEVRLAFEPTVAGAQASYTSDTELQIVLQGAAVGGTVAEGEIESRVDLNHVEAIDVAEDAGSLVVTLTLDEQRPYILSPTQVPPELRITIG